MSHNTEPGSTLCLRAGAIEDVAAARKLSAMGWDYTGISQAA